MSKCKWGRAHVATGFSGGPPYVRIEGGGVDGLGTQHCYLMAKCDRCGEQFTLAMLHMPGNFDAKTKTMKEQP